MTGTAQRSRANSNASHNDSSAARDAALYGAAKAFGTSPRARTTNVLNIDSSSPKVNGALLAAVSAGHAKKPSPKLPVPAEGAAVGPLRKDQKSRMISQANNTAPVPTNANGETSLGVPERPSRGISRSPSYQAATVAAARASPAPPTGEALQNTQTRNKAIASKPVVKAKPRPSHVRSDSAASGVAQDSPRSNRPDTSSIAPTTSLVKLFENSKASEGQSRNPSAAAPMIRVAEPTPIQSPRPLRRSSLLKGDAPPMFDGEGTVRRMMAAATNQREPARIASSGPHPSERVPASVKEKSPSPAEKVAKRPLPPPARRTIKAPEAREGSLAVPTLTRPKTRSPRPQISPTQSAPSVSRKGSRNLAPQEVAASQPQRSITATYHQLHPRYISPLTTGDSLANAMVGASLAATRAPSPTRLPPPPLGSHNPKHHHLFGKTSPPKKGGMRHTMRKEKEESSDETDDEDPYGKHKKKRHLRKHPNKHHEGDRKRWRNAVTERERKRYEGVWAANKGLLCTFTPAEQRFLARFPDGKDSAAIREQVPEQVSNLVVKDLWMRSRLPAHILEEVWSLVDSQENGRLLKEEFVVGLWLIDQRLKGRKLPTKVTDSVWNSVRLLQGIKIRKIR